MKKINLLIITFLLSASCGYAQIDKLNILLNIFKQDSTLRNASWSFCLMDNATSKIIAEKDKQLSLLPASSMKTITTATALALLGENYRYKTSIVYTGKIENKVLNGDIIIKGSGDPTLGSDRIAGSPSYTQLIQYIVDSIKAIGIQTLNGRIIADESCFEGAVIPNTWNWSDIGNYYGAGASGLNFNENSYDIFFKPCTVNKSTPVISRIVPEIPSLTFTNELVACDTTDNMDDAYIYGAPYSYQRLLAGPVPLDVKEFSISGSMPDPALYMAQMLTVALAAQEIEIKKMPTTSRLLEDDKTWNDKNITTLANFFSPRLKEIITLTNQKSINLYAEALLKTIAKEKGNAATTENGTQIVKAYWQAKNLDLGGFYMKDGSGLSRHNAVSPYHFTQILQQISKEKYFTAFKNSLAVAGRSGTLRGLCGGTIAEGKIFAKSGTIERGISYTGYVEFTSGKLYSFSIIFNNYNSKNLLLRQKIAKLMVAMAGM